MLHRILWFAMSLQKHFIMHLACRVQSNCLDGFPMCACCSLSQFFPRVLPIHPEKSVARSTKNLTRHSNT